MGNSGIGENPSLGVCVRGDTNLCHEVECNVVNEVCDEGACRCGTAPSCEGNATLPYCDKENNQCRPYPSSCYDGKLNFNEVNYDCGGDCESCECVYNRDCNGSLVCRKGKCSDPLSEVCTKCTCGNTNDLNLYSSNTSLFECKKGCAENPACIGIEYWSGVDTNDRYPSQICKECSNIADHQPFDDLDDPGYPPAVYGKDCVDTDDGLTDKYDTGCKFYDENPSRCGKDDDGDFKSKEMCCSCKTCSNDEDCIAGIQSCIEGICREPTDCMVNLDCEEGLVCVHGKCKNCEVDSECDSGFQCVEGQCKEICVDKDEGATDSNGNTCASFYDYNPARCGCCDNDYFNSATMCCSCKDTKLCTNGGECPSYRPYCVNGTCSECCENEDEKTNATDSNGSTCKDYYSYQPDKCGKYDDDDFIASELCCDCKRIVGNGGSDDGKTEKVSSKKHKNHWTIANQHE